MIHEILMPALSSTMKEGKIVEWLKSPGEKVEKNDSVLVVESDKADMDVESFYEGYVGVIIAEAGETVPVHTVIGLLAETEAEIAEAKEKASSIKSGGTAKEEKVITTPQTVATSTSNNNNVVATSNGNGNGNGRIVASPRARKLAKEYKVDLKTLQGSGPYGRIIAVDVERASSVPSTTPTTTTTIAPPVTETVTIAPPTPIPVNTMSGETVPMNTLQKAVVQNMMMSLQVPVFRVSYTITTDALDKLYKQIKPKGVTMTALLAKAVATTLQKHPIVNASYAPDATKYNTDINIAVAVAMPDGGLITPVLSNPHLIDIYSLSRTWKDLVARSRSKQLKPEEYSTGTFTLSNLGMFGVDRFDAILPPGQGSILAIGSSIPQVVANDAGMMGIQNRMSVNMTSDHRIIYGAQSASFLKDLATLIEKNVQSLTL